MTDLTKEQVLEFMRVEKRIKKHGENITLKRGRKTLSVSHKKRVRKEWKERLKQEKIDNGTYRGKGRPKKVVKVITIDKLKPKTEYVMMPDVPDGYPVLNEKICYV